MYNGFPNAEQIYLGGTYQRQKNLLNGACVSSVISAVYLMGRALSSNSPSEATVLVSSSGFLFASAGILLSNVINISLKNRDESRKYLGMIAERMRGSAELNKLWLEHDIDRKIANETDKEEFFINNALTHPLFMCIRDIANAYEEIGVAIAESTVDETMMRRSFATNLRWFWPRLEPFISLYRNDPPRIGHPHGKEPNQQVFSHCEALADMWRGEEV